MEECTKDQQLKCVTYKEGPQVRANGGTKENAPRDLDKGPHVRLPEEDKDKLLPGWVGRTQGSAEPSQHPVQMHFNVTCPLLLLITDLEDYKRGLPPPFTTHTISYVKEKSREAPRLCIISLESM